MYRCTPFCLSFTDETYFHFGVWWRAVFVLKYIAMTTVCSQWSVLTASWAPHGSVMAEEFLAGSLSFSFLRLIVPLIFSVYLSIMPHIWGVRFWFQNVLYRENCVLEVFARLAWVSSTCLVNTDAGRHLSSLWLTTTECVMWLLAGGSGIIWHWLAEHYHSWVALEIILGSFIRISR